MLEKGVMEVEFLEDGRVKVDTGDMSGKNHRTADDFLSVLAYVCGGEVERKKKRGHSHHTHSHETNREIEQ